MVVDYIHWKLRELCLGRPQATFVVLKANWDYTVEMWSVFEYFTALMLRRRTNHHDWNCSFYDSLSCSLFFWSLTFSDTF